MNDREEAAANTSRIDTQAQAWLLRLRHETPPPRDAFEDWYVADPAHALAYELLLTTWDATGGLDRLPRGVGTVPARRGWRAITAVAAIVLAAVGIGIVSLAGLGRTPANAVVLETKLGEIRTERLADGTRVTLDTDSRVELLLGASDHTLRLVRGRARIANALGVSEPVEINAAGAIVRGGRVVDITRRDAQTMVTMVEGSGRVQLGPTPIVLAAEQTIAIPDRGSDAPQPSARTFDRRWPSGMLSFANAPLSDVVADVNRYNADHIILAGPAVASRRFTGTVRVGDPSGLAHMLAAALHLTVSRRAGNAFVLSERPVSK